MCFALARTLIGSHPSRGSAVLFEQATPDHDHWPTSDRRASADANREERPCIQLPSGQGRRANTEHETSLQCWLSNPSTRVTQPGTHQHHFSPSLPFPSLPFYACCDASFPSNGSSITTKLSRRLSLRLRRSYGVSPHPCVWAGRSCHHDRHHSRRRAAAPTCSRISLSGCMR